MGEASNLVYVLYFFLIIELALEELSMNSTPNIIRFCNGSYYVLNILVLFLSQLGNPSVVI